VAANHLTLLVWLCLTVPQALLLPRLLVAQDACTPTPTLKTSVVLAWTAPVQPAGVTTTGYVVDRRVDSGLWAPFSTTSITVLTVTDTGLTPGHSYYYRVSDVARAADGSTGQSGYATNAPAPALPPCVAVQVVNAPTNPTATPQ
jgi:hypothetical protein